MDNRFADMLAALRSDTRDGLDEFAAKIKLKQMLDEEEDKNRLFKTIGIVVAAIAVIAFAAYMVYLVYRMLRPDYLDDYDDYDYDYDYDVDDLDDEADEVAVEGDDDETPRDDPAVWI